MMIVEEEQNNKEKLKKNILDNNLELKYRIKNFEEYILLDYNAGLELLNTYCSQYNFSGTHNIKILLHNLCCNSNIDNILKIKCCKSLLSFEEFEEGSDSEDDEEFTKIKKESDTMVRQRNEKRFELAYESINMVCENWKKVPTPIKMEMIHILMKKEVYKKECEKYFLKVLNDNNLESEYKYKCILSLENLDIQNKEYFIKSFMSDFIKNDKNNIYYRILSGQFLLKKNKDYDIQELLLSFCNDENIEYNRRADSADVLLTFGNESYKKKGEIIINKLGNDNNKDKTVYGNSQNVHTKQVDKSVNDILIKLSSFPILKLDNKNYISFSDIKNEILKLITEENNKEKILQALNRIEIDNALYSKFNDSLKNILIKVWSYIQNNKNKIEMSKRLLQELEDMSGTCSSGFISRMVNSVSGFNEEMNIKISWEDQIISNVSGRLNYRITKIKDKDSIYYNEKLEEVIILWLNDNVEIKTKIIDNIKIKNNTKITHIEDIIKEVKLLDYDEICVEIFYDNVISELSISSSNPVDKKNFLLFFRNTIQCIRDELYEEFIKYISENEFDLYFRNAIMNYEK